MRIAHMQLREQKKSAKVQMLEKTTVLWSSRTYYYSMDKLSTFYQRWACVFSLSRYIYLLFSKGPSRCASLRYLKKKINNFRAFAIFVPLLILHAQMGGKLPPLPL